MKKDLLFYVTIILIAVFMLVLNNSPSKAAIEINQNIKAITDSITRYQTIESEADPLEEERPGYGQEYEIGEETETEEPSVYNPPAQEEEPQEEEPKEETEEYSGFSW